MNNLKELIELFDLSEDNIKDNLMNVEYYNQVSPCKIPNIEKIKEILLKFPKRDKVRIEYSNVTEDTIIIDNYEEIDSIKYVDFIKENADPEYSINVYIKITKSTNDKRISIYDFNCFWKELCENDILYSMDFFSRRLKESQQIIFVNFDNDYNFSTKTIAMTQEQSDIEIEQYNRNISIEKCKSISTFWNMEEYELIPEDFHIQISYIPTEIKRLFEKTKYILSLIYISNTSRIENFNLYLQINGYKNREYNINLEEFKYDNKYEEFYDIYSWSIFEGNVIDKIGLVREVMSIHCKYANVLDINKTTFDSIKSNYKLYLRDNVNKYIDFKNKAVEFIMKISKTTNEIIMEFISNLKKNIATFFTFILGTVLANIVSDNPIDNIFTNDVVAICCWILLGSFIYLFISLKEMNFKKDRYIEEYNQLKLSYRDVLDENDIIEIFDNDKVYKENIDTLSKIKKKYTIVWITMIICTGIAICVYKNFNIFEYFFNIIKPIVCTISQLIKCISFI